MKAPVSKRSRSAAPAFAKWTLLLAGLAYTGFVTTRFEQEFGWHFAPTGLLMMVGSLYLAEWIERLLGDRVS